MTYSVGVPNAGQSPGLFPTQGNVNFSRLLTIIGVNHQFNLSAASNDGYHNLVVLTPQAPSGNLAGFGRLYCKAVSSIQQLFFMTDTAVEYQITPVPIISTGTASLGAGGTQNIFTAAYDFVATVTVVTNGTTIAFQAPVFANAGVGSYMASAFTSGSPLYFVNVSFVGLTATIYIDNTLGGATNVTWSVSVTRMS